MARGGRRRPTAGAKLVGLVLAAAWCLLALLACQAAGQNVELTIGDVVVNELNAGTQAVSLPLSLAVGGQDTGVVMLSYTTSDGSAFVGNADYQAASGGFNMVGTTTTDPGPDIDFLALNTFGDVITEADEVFYVTWTIVSSGCDCVIFAGGDNIGSVTITNDDTSRVAIDDVTVAEGDAGLTSYAFTLR